MEEGAGVVVQVPRQPYAQGMGTALPELQEEGAVLAAANQGAHPTSPGPGGDPGPDQGFRCGVHDPAGEDGRGFQPQVGHKPRLPENDLDVLRAQVEEALLLHADRRGAGGQGTQFEPTFFVGLRPGGVVP